MVFLQFSKDLLKLTINSHHLRTLTNILHISHIQMQLIYMDTLWWNLSQLNYLIGCSNNSPIGCRSWSWLTWWNAWFAWLSFSRGKIEVAEKMLCKYQLQSYKSFSLGKKYTISLIDVIKRKYKLHYQNLKLCLHLGLQLKNIYRVWEFNQERFLKPFIECTTDLQREAEKKCRKIKKS